MLDLSKKWELLHGAWKEVNDKRTTLEESWRGKSGQGRGLFCRRKRVIINVWLIGSWNKGNNGNFELLMEGAEPLCFFVLLRNILLHEYRILSRKNDSVTPQKPHLCLHCCGAMGSHGCPAWAALHCVSTGRALHQQFSYLQFASFWLWGIPNSIVNNASGLSIFIIADTVERYLRKLETCFFFSGSFQMLLRLTWMFLLQCVHRH